ncbi:unnamed protein product [Paramecium pentaurelia]|uniref:Transmembrane protein n=1 Tax=Paramecium pentaurelia TaxID=43138 RepID=A0A8S1WTS5_9CILI|nr:unnamed protein product [Paramecium pentaurelia]
MILEVMEFFQQHQIFMYEQSENIIIILIVSHFKDINFYFHFSEELELKCKWQTQGSQHIQNSHNLLFQQQFQLIIYRNQHLKLLLKSIFKQVYQITQTQMPIIYKLCNIYQIVIYPTIPFIIYYQLYVFSGNYLTSDGLANTYAVIIHFNIFEVYRLFLMKIIRRRETRRKSNKGLKVKIHSQDLQLEEALREWVCLGFSNSCGGGTYLLFGNMTSGPIISQSVSALVLETSVQFIADQRWKVSLCQFEALPFPEYSFPVQRIGKTSLLFQNILQREFLLQYNKFSTSSMIYTCGKPIKSQKLSLQFDSNEKKYFYISFNIIIEVVITAIFINIYLNQTSNIQEIQENAKSKDQSNVIQKSNVIQQKLINSLYETAILLSYQKYQIQDSLKKQEDAIKKTLKAVDVILLDYESLVNYSKKQQLFIQQLVDKYKIPIEKIILGTKNSNSHQFIQNDFKSQLQQTGIYQCIK